MKTSLLPTLVSASIAAGSALFWLSPAQAAAMSKLIDNFTDVTPSLTVTPGLGNSATAVTIGAPGDGFVGTTRTLTVFDVAGSGVNSTVTIGVTREGILDAGQTANITAKASTTYAGLTGADRILNGGNNYFGMDILLAEHDFGIVAKLTDGSGAMTTVAGTIAAGTKKVEIPLTKFGGVDLQDIAQVMITYDFYTPNTDVQIDAVGVGYDPKFAPQPREDVPEPSSLLSLGLVATGMLAYRKRRQKSKS